MRVLVHEQEFSGHHYMYLGHLLPALADLVDEVVVAITPYGAQTQEYRTHLAPLEGRVDIQPALPPGDQGLGLKARFRLLGDLKESVRRSRPDYLLVPSGDGVTTAMGLLGPLGRGGLPGRVPAEVGIHYGYGLAGVGAKNRLKDELYRRTQRLSSWTKVHYASVTNFDRVRERGGTLAARADLMPHPVPSSPRYPREESRRLLGLPEDGRYIGLAAGLDPRKAIPELLAAFRRAAGDSDRLLMAGRLHPPFARLIEGEYGDLVRQGRLIVRDGYFDQETMDRVVGALDVVCAPYVRFGQLSAAMLEGVAAGRPVLVNDFGWMGAMVRRFGFGGTCDIHDPDSFASAIRKALDGAAGYRESEATRRLLEFHAPGNFARCWLRGIREAMGRPPEAGFVSWSEVVEALGRGEAPARRA